MTGEWLSTWDTTQAAMQPNRLPSQVFIKVTVPNVRGQRPGTDLRHARDAFR